MLVANPSQGILGMAACYVGCGFQPRPEFKAMFIDAAASYMQVRGAHTLMHSHAHTHTHTHIYTLTCTYACACNVQSNACDFTRGFSHSVCNAPPTTLLPAVDRAAVFVVEDLSSTSLCLSYYMDFSLYWLQMADKRCFEAQEHTRTHACTHARTHARTHINYTEHFQLSMQLAEQQCLEAEDALSRAAEAKKVGRRGGLIEVGACALAYVWC
jgi:hypothetical protein